LNQLRKSGLQRE
jgi:hypothetical protein